nr:phage holin family protein [Clostridioides mangenotii]
MPHILLTLGIIYSIWIQGVSPGSVLQGLLCAGSSMGL